MYTIKLQLEHPLLLSTGYFYIRVTLIFNGTSSETTIPPEFKMSGLFKKSMPMLWTVLEALK